MSVDPLEGAVRVSAPHHLDGKQLKLQVVCDFVYEDDDYDIHKEVLYDTVHTLYPPSDEAPRMTPAQKALLRKIGRNSYPFLLTLPYGMPASVVLKPEVYGDGRPIGISWSMRAFLMAPGATERLSLASLPFQKINYTPLLPDVPPPRVTGSKTFMFESSYPLKMTVSLEKDVFQHGEPILVKVDIENNSKKDVNAVKISAKQVTEVRMDKIKRTLKSQVAVLESTRNCPVKKQSTLTYTYSITPKIIAQETHYAAQEPKLSMNEPSMLASSARLWHSPVDAQDGVVVMYYMNVHAIVTLGSDLILRVPFIISHKPAPKVDLVLRQASQPTLPPASTPAAAPGKSAPEAPQVEETVEPEPNVDLLIDLSDAPATAPEPAAPKALPPSALATDVFASVSTESASGQAGAIVAQLMQSLMATVAHISAGQVDVRAASGSEIPALLEAGRLLGAAVSQLLQEASCVKRDGNPACVPALIGTFVPTARTLQQYVLAAGNLALVCSQPEAQLRVLQAVQEVANKVALLLDMAKRLAVDPSVEAKAALGGLGEYLNQALPAVLAALPGQRECHVAMSIISVAAGEVAAQGAQSAASQADADGLSGAVDALHADAQALSQAFKAIGAACIGPDASMDALAAAAQAFQVALPPVLGHGKAIALGLEDANARSRLLRLLQTVAQRSMELLDAARQMHASAGPAAREKLEQCGSAVVEAMRLLLSGTLQLKQHDVELRRLASALQKAGPTVSPAAAQLIAEMDAAPVPPAPLISPRPEVCADASDLSSSFDTYIQARAAAGGAGHGVVGAEYAKALAGIDAAVRRIDGSSKLLVAAQARPRRKSVIRSQPVLSGRAAILDAVLPIVRAVSTLVDSARQRALELGILGRAFHASSFRQTDSAWQELLMGACAAIATATEALVQTADQVSQGDASVEALAKCANAVSTEAARLVATSLVQEHVNGNSQLGVEMACRAVTQTTSKLAGLCHEAMSAPSGPSSGGAPASPTIGAQMQILRLEQSLESIELAKFSEPRRGSHWAT